MLAGGMVIAAPSMVPEAAAAGALYVSAENAQFENHFAGASVVEIIVKDPSRSATNEAAAEPTVFVDNQQVRMAQGLDGYWYAYIGDSTDIAAVAAYTTDELSWGTAAEILGSTNTPGGFPGIITYDAATYTNGTDSVAITDTFNFNGVIDNPPVLSNWNNSGIAAAATCSACGQIGMHSGAWPVIQAFDFTQGDFDIVLKTAGND